ncbi:hypothetical protein AbraIFM66950_003519 [Aspergillus brasiliensis]|nr:hypothetical protein AbraIFM66950_003519 [Aspergillus brasiliensis]
MELQDSPASSRRSSKKRVRVTRACDACKSCLKTGKDCEYTAEYNRGKPPQVRITQPPVPGNEQQQEAATEGGRPPPLPYTQILEEYDMPESQVEAPASRASPEHQTDLEGHYVGPSSGVSFLLRAQRKLHKYVALPINTPIFTFGDSPLPEVESAFMLLPPRNEANALVTRYFDFAFPTHRFLHQPQVEGWVEEFYRAVRDSEAVSPGMRGRRAVVLMVFAQAKQGQPDRDQSSARSVISYFAASEQQLSAETGPVRITSVQARLAQCFYLLSQSRINHCWSLFGTTARLAMTIGLHRARRRENGTRVDHIEAECRKRVFWCAYSLDNYLSAALGRPRIFHDDDIDQDFPTVADDSQILRDQIIGPVSTSQSIMLAPLYHARLSVIIGRILHDMYGVRRGGSQAEVSAAVQHGAELTRWRQEISSFLDTPNVDLLMLTYQRQYTVLNLAFFHAQILLYRPFILRNFGNISRERPREDSSNKPLDDYIEICLDAAMRIAAIIRELCKKRRMYSTFWFTHYYAFSAIMILYFRVIQLAAQRGNAEEEYLKYLRTGECAQQDLASCSSQSSFVQRYVVVLEELRQEARMAVNQPEPHDRRIPDAGNSEEVIRPDELDVDHTNVSGGLQGGSLVPPMMDYNLSQWGEGVAEDSFPMPDLPGSADWEGLDSLAIAGLGELDFLFSHAEN